MLASDLDVLILSCARKKPSAESADYDFVTSAPAQSLLSDARATKDLADILCFVGFGGVLAVQRFQNHIVEFIVRARARSLCFILATCIVSQLMHYEH